MKKNYLEPELEIIELSPLDIIVTSQFTDGKEQEEETETGWGDLGWN